MGDVNKTYLITTSIQWLPWSRQLLIAFKVIDQTIFETGAYYNRDYIPEALNSIVSGVTAAAVPAGPRMMIRRPCELLLHEITRNYFRATATPPKSELNECFRGTTDRLPIPQQLVTGGARLTTTRKKESLLVGVSCGGVQQSAVSLLIKQTNQCTLATKSPMLSTL